MLSMNNPEYLDVFISTEQAWNSYRLLGLAALVFVVAFAFPAYKLFSTLTAFSTTPKELPPNQTRIYTKMLTIFLLLSTISTVGSIYHMFDYNNTVKTVEENMKHNVHEKYGATLQGWGMFAGKRVETETLNQPRQHVLIFDIDENGNGDKKPFLLRFDPHTSEPFISEVSRASTPTASELEVLANK